MTSTSFPSELVLKALTFAAFHHRHQKRKDDQTPYISHPARVMTLVAVEFGETDPEVLAAAALHDTIEDTNADCDDIVEAFGLRVASFVAALTKDKRLPEPERETRFFEQVLAAPPEVKLIKLADTLDNLLDLGTIGDETKRRDSERKQIDKARKMLERFAPDIAPRWPRALELLRARVDAHPG